MVVSCGQRVGLFFLRGATNPLSFVRDYIVMGVFMGKKAPSVTMTFRAETLKRLEIAEELVKFDHPTTPQQHFDVGNQRIFFSE